MRIKVLIVILSICMLSGSIFGADIPLVEPAQGNKSNSIPFWFMLNISSGITVPSGDYYKGMESGLALNGGFSISISSKLGIKITGGRAGVLKDDRTVFLLTEDPKIEFQEVRLETYLLRYLIGLEYRGKSDNSAKNGDSFWYLFSGIGGLNNRMSLEYTEADLLDGSRVYRNTVGDDWDIISSLGAGFLFAAGSSFGLDVSINWDMVIGKGNYSEAFVGKIDERYGISGYLLEIRVGLYKTI